MTNAELLDELRQLYRQGEVLIMVDGNEFQIDRIDEDVAGEIRIYVME